MRWFSRFCHGSRIWVPSASCQANTIFSFVLQSLEPRSSFEVWKHFVEKLRSSGLQLVTSSLKLHTYALRPVVYCSAHRNSMWVASCTTDTSQAINLALGFGSRLSAWLSVLKRRLWPPWPYENNGKNTGGAMSKKTAGSGQTFLLTFQWSFHELQLNMCKFEARGIVADSDNCSHLHTYI